MTDAPRAKIYRLTEHASLRDIVQQDMLRRSVGWERAMTGDRTKDHQRSDVADTNCYPQPSSEP